MKTQTNKELYVYVHTVLLVVFIAFLTEDTSAS